MRNVSEVIQGPEDRFNERIVSSLLPTPSLLRRWEEIALKSEDITEHIDEAVALLLKSPYFYL